MNRNGKAVERETRQKSERRGEAGNRTGGRRDKNKRGGRNTLAANDCGSEDTISTMKPHAFATFSCAMAIGTSRPSGSRKAQRSPAGPNRVMAFDFDQKKKERERTRQSKKRVRGSKPQKGGEGGVNRTCSDASANCVRTAQSGATSTRDAATASTATAFSRAESVRRAAANCFTIVRRRSRTVAAISVCLAG
jgi:hypothetical protein